MIEDIRQDRLDQKSLELIKNTFTLDDRELYSLIINIKYEIYMKREMEKIKSFNTYSNMDIPEGIKYKKIKNISKEAIMNLERYHPGTIQQASRLEGIKPLDLFVLITFIENVSRETSIIK